MSHIAVVYVAVHNCNWDSGQFTIMPFTLTYRCYRRRMRQLQGQRWHQAKGLVCLLASLLRRLQRSPLCPPSSRWLCFAGASAGVPRNHPRLIRLLASVVKSFGRKFAGSGALACQQCALVTAGKLVAVRCALLLDQAAPSQARRGSVS